MMTVPGSMDGDRREQECWSPGVEPHLLVKQGLSPNYRMIIILKNPLITV
jgi:hypothetical protein